MNRHSATTPSYDAVTYEQLVGFALGTLDLASQQQVAEHLDECRECREQLAALNGVVRTTRSTVPSAPPAWMVHRAKQLFTHHEVETASRTDRVRAFLTDWQTVIGSLALVVVGALALSGVYVWQHTPAARAADVGVVEPGVEIRNNQAGDWAPVTTTASLRAGTGLRTTPDGSVELTFPDGSTVVVTGGTAIETKALHTLAAVGPQIARLEQAVGHAKYQIAPGSPGGEFRVTTPVASIQGRDVEYDLRVGQDGTTIVQVHAGTLRVSAGTQDVNVPAGQQLVISPTAPAAPLQPSPFPVTPTPVPTASPTATRIPPPAVAPVRPSVTWTLTLTATVSATPTPTRVSGRAPARATGQPSNTPVPTRTASPTRTRTVPPPTFTPSATPVPPTNTPQPPPPPTDEPPPRPTDTPPPPPTDTPPPPPTDTPPPPPTDTPAPPPTDTPAPPPTLPPVIEVTKTPANGDSAAGDPQRALHRVTTSFNGARP